MIKKFGQAQNIMGPVKGQGKSSYIKFRKLVLTENPLNHPLVNRISDFTGDSSIRVATDLGSVERLTGPDFLHVRSQYYLQKSPLFNAWHLVFGSILIKKCNNSVS